jgi:YD repeat-containing protein
MKKIFLVTAAAAMACASCKKNKASDPVPAAGTKLLMKLTKTEGTTTTVFNFVYDAGKRLVSYKSTDNTVGILFSYDAAGNLVKVEDTEDNYKNVYTYSYTNNVPVSGSFKSWRKTAGEPDNLIEDDQLTYTLVNNQVSKIHVAFLQTADAADFALTYNSTGNLVKIVSSGSGGYTASFSYGSRKPVYPVLSKYILDESGFSLQFAAKNELLSFSFDFPGTQYDQSVSTQYTYDADGYALTSSDAVAQIKYEYQ